MSESKRSGLRRSINSLAMRDGETQESKLFATVGKCLCIWLIYKYAEALIGHWEVLLVLLSWLIAPDIAKKAITMRFGGSQNGFSERVEHKESSSVVTKSKVDSPE